ncbi:BURP domain protein RD22 [Prunus persica]|uniref:BURP domain protein RD22 n=1 Tax=Prunus persica TaxID=3760 RepID=UPI0009AB8310|nr:BURP domain protein RD22 [Prunus persica]
MTVMHSTSWMLSIKSQLRLSLISVLTGFHLPLIFALLSLAAVALANHAAQPAPQLYWNSVLPNTQMPRAISELLHPDSTNEEKSTNVMNAVGNGKPIDHKGNLKILYYHSLHDAHFLTRVMIVPLTINSIIKT